MNLNKKHLVVCMAGSTRYKDQHQAYEENLTRSGKIVLPLGAYCQADNRPVTDEDLAMFVDLWKAKCDMADVIFCVSPREWGDRHGHVGETTMNDLKYAISKYKPICFSEDPGPETMKLLMADADHAIELVKPSELIIMRKAYGVPELNMNREFG